MAEVKVKVAVRVRPLNQKEKDKDSPSVVEVNGNQISLHPPNQNLLESSNNSLKKFTYDYCFLSKDQEHAGQEEVFHTLGKELLDNVFQGYNACIFAYGQTGSGKSFSVMGTDQQPGLIPMISSELFKREQDNATQLRVEISFIEIYNETVKDLLPKKPQRNQKLKVREDKVLGPYVEGLCHHPVSNSETINLLIQKGGRVRATAATNMNEESSRSHAIFTITITQIHVNQSSGSPKEIIGKLSLVDLAGSERVSKTGCDGDRLKESANINKSLTALGIVISNLAELPDGKRRSNYVNYRDSVLTMLLKNSLGGNSKTVMLATISPAEDNYQETLSTLRYADRAKHIVNQAVVNEDITCKAIDELHGEILELEKKLRQAELEHREQLESVLKEKEDLLQELNKTWKEKLRIIEDVQERQKHLESMGISVEPWGIKIDPEKSFMIALNYNPAHKYLVYFLKEENRVGSGPSQDIQLCGPEIKEEHCILNLHSSSLIILENAQTRVNSCLVQRTDLWNGDVITLGSYCFLLHLPSRKRQSSNYVMDTVKIHGNLDLVQTQETSFQELHGINTIKDSHSLTSSLNHSNISFPMVPDDDRQETLPLMPASCKPTEDCQSDETNYKIVRHEHKITRKCSETQKPNEALPCVMPEAGGSKYQTGISTVTSNREDVCAMCKKRPQASLKVPLTELLTTVNTGRCVAIEICNKTRSTTFLNPWYFCQSGYVYVPPPPTIPPDTMDNCIFVKRRKSWCGSVGVFTYHFSGNRTIAIMFSNPFDYNLYNITFGVWISNKTCKADRLLFKNLYYSKSSSSSFQRVEVNKCTGSLEINKCDLMVSATMSNDYKAILKVEIADNIRP